MRRAGSGDRRQGQAAKNLSLVRDAVGDPAATAGPGAVYEAGCDCGGDEPESSNRERHRERATDAERKTEAVCHFRAQAHGMKTTANRAVEMTVCEKRGKPKAGFPSFPTALGNRQSAIPTVPQPRRQPRGKVEIQKQDSHFPVAALVPLRKNERRLPLNAGCPVDQAHRSIGICSRRREVIIRERMTLSRPLLVWIVG